MIFHKLSGAWGLCLVALVVVTTATTAQETVKVAEGVPSYTAVSGVSGSLNSIGSDTMNNLMTLWAEGFAKFYPGVRVQVEGKGSSTAPPRPDQRDRPARPHVPSDEGQRDR